MRKRETAKKREKQSDLLRILEDDRQFITE